MTVPEQHNSSAWEADSRRQASEDKEVEEIKLKMSVKEGQRSGSVAYDFILRVRRNVTSSRLARAIM